MPWIVHLFPINPTSQDTPATATGECSYTGHPPVPFNFLKPVPGVCLFSTVFPLISSFPYLPSPPPHTTHPGTARGTQTTTDAGKSPTGLFSLTVVLVVMATIISC